MAHESMLKFVGREQKYPEKREAEARADDFREIAARYAVPAAEEQAHGGPGQREGRDQPREVEHVLTPEARSRRRRWRSGGAGRR